jgi:HAE1 family hydrophobic/amphiphilic exporter-1
MEGTVAQITRIFHEDPAVTGVFAAVGGTTANAFSGSSGGSLQNAQLTILLKSNRHISGEAFRAKYRKDLQVIPDARVSFLSADGTAGFQQVLTGDDSKAIDQAAYELERQMRGLTVLADPRPASPPSGPEIVIRPRAAEAARLGVSVDSIAQVARVATVGDIDANVAKLTRASGGSRSACACRRTPRRPRPDPGAASRRPAAARRLDGGRCVFQAGPAKIDRLNRRKRQVTVEAELNGAELGQAIQAVNKLPIMKNLPKGVGRPPAGDQEADGRAVRRLRRRPASRAWR